MEMLRHVAKVANTDQRCVVVFMQIPGREDHALVVPIDNLPPRMEQAVMDVLQSPDGQNEETFANALSRNLMPDTGKDILQTLHSNNRLVPVPISQVLMMPRPNQPVKLSTILEQLGRLPDQQSRGLMEDYAVNKFNPHQHNQQAESSEQSRNIARNLLVEAEMLESDARRKREQAYGYDASLRPHPLYSADKLENFAPPNVAAEPITESVAPESVPVAEPQQDSELLTMMGKLMDRVEAQDKVLHELQAKRESSENKRRARTQTEQ